MFLDSLFVREGSDFLDRIHGRRPRDQQDIDILVFSLQRESDILPIEVRIAVLGIDDIVSEFHEILLGPLQKMRIGSVQDDIHISLSRMRLHVRKEMRTEIRAVEIRQPFSLREEIEEL